MKAVRSVLSSTLIFIVIFTVISAPAFAGGKQKGVFDCPAGQVVVGTNEDGSPKCAFPIAPFDCNEGEAVTGFDANGDPVCSDAPSLVACPCFTLQTLIDSRTAYVNANQQPFFNERKKL